MKIECICKNCNTPIDCKKQFCDRNCYLQFHNKFGMYKNRLCLECGMIFISNRRGEKITTHNFCSNECKFKWQKINPPKKKTGINKKCEFCGELFYTQKNQNKYRFCSSNCGNLNRKNKPNPKHSKIMSDLISSGIYHPKRNHYKQGFYTSVITHKKEFYGSSYELKRMEQLDSMGLKWTKKHGITIKYIDAMGHSRYYIPDFLVENKILEEVKPKSLVNSVTDNNCYKNEASQKYCTENNLQYRIITEKELNIL